jgi:hypothetical protein
MAETIKTILTADSSNFRNEFSKASAQLVNWQKKAMALGAGVAGILGGKKLLSSFNALRDSLGQLEDGALRLEMPVEDFQRLRAVAELTGASVESLSKALTKSQLNAIAAAQGGKDLENEFTKLGISARDFLAMNHTERLLAISRGFNSASDQGAAFAAVFKVMGKGASELIPLLRDSEAGIESVSRRLEVLNSTDVAAFNKMSDEIDLMSFNIKTNLSKALLDVQPQIEGFVSLLSGAASGVSDFFDKAGGIGKQGGQLGGEEMLREMERLGKRIGEIKAKQRDGVAWYEGPLGLTLERQKSGAAMATLKGRYGALGAEAQILAEQTIAAERLKASGLSEDALQAELEAMQGRTAESLRAIAAERGIAVAANGAAVEMENQNAAAEKLATTLQSIQEKVGGRIFDLQTPNIRKSAAQAGLADILKGEKVETLNELRLKVGSTESPEDRTKSLQALDKALDLMEEIKRASAEIQSRETERFNNWAAQMEREKEAKDQLSENAGNLAIKKAANKAARDEFAAESAALRAEMKGRSDIAEGIREEMRLRSESAYLAEKLGVSEAEALTMLRARAVEERKIKQLSEQPALPGTQQQPTKRTSSIRRLANGAFDTNAGNNLNNWKWNLGQDSQKIGFRDAGSRRIGDPRPFGGGVAAGLKADALNRRGMDRNSGNSEQRLIAVVDKHLSGSSNFQDSVLKFLNGLGVA